MSLNILNKSFLLVRRVWSFATSRGSGSNKSSKSNSRPKRNDRNRTYYDLPMLASYPRSGSNWIRYFVELISGRPTPGKVILVEGDDFYMERSHFAHSEMDSYRMTVLLLRDYRECILRHQLAFWQSVQDVKAFLSDESLKHPPSLYVDNIIAFDALEGEKHVIYYEDMVSDPEDFFRHLAVILKLDPIRTEDFIDNLDSHYEESVARYKSNGHDSVTSSSKKLNYHTEENLSNDQAKSFDDYYFSRYPEIAEKYLSRYRISI